MSASDPRQLGKASGSRGRMIRRIAEALGEPETVFFDSADAESGDRRELLWLWHSLTDYADRQKVLMFVRTVASERAGAIRT